LFLRSPLPEVVIPQPRLEDHAVCRPPGIRVPFVLLSGQTER
jgi:hypothetical protein